MQRTSRLALAALVTTLLLAAGCSDTTDTTDPGTDAQATPLAEAPPTPVAPSEDGEDTEGDQGGATDDAADEDAGQEPTSDAATAVPAGDGCTPGTTDTLPDGEWFGFLVNTTGDDIEFDLACWYSGEDAELVAAERGEPEITNDYIITNDNPALRTLPRVGELEVERLTDDLQTEVVTFDEYLDAEGFYATICPGLDCSVWISVSDGTVVDLVEQYRP